MSMHLRISPSVEGTGVVKVSINLLTAQGDLDADGVLRNVWERVMIDQETSSLSVRPDWVPVLQAFDHLRNMGTLRKGGYSKVWDSLSGHHLHFALEIRNPVITGT